MDPVALPLADSSLTRGVPLNPAVDAAFQGCPYVANTSIPLGPNVRADRGGGVDRGTHAKLLAKEPESHSLI